MKINIRFFSVTDVEHDSYRHTSCCYHIFDLSLFSIKIYEHPDVLTHNMGMLIYKRSGCFKIKHGDVLSHKNNKESNRKDIH